MQPDPDHRKEGRTDDNHTGSRARGPCAGTGEVLQTTARVRGVDFDIAGGTIFALLGSNGAGKTTVIKILSTLLKADAGAASVNGFDVAAQAADVRASISLTGQFARPVLET